MSHGSQAVSIMKNITRNILPVLLALTAGLNNATVVADDQQQFESILKMSKSPDGVVFEILADEDGLEWAIPRIQHYSHYLREKFPHIAIAVVSHGNEQFALQTDYQEDNKEIHTQVKSLLGSKVQIHVCGTYAGWKGINPEDFPDYVDVVPSGPAQIRSYIELGYTRIEVEPPEDH